MPRALNGSAVASRCRHRTTAAQSRRSDAAVANGDEYIALAPSSIKTAVTHQVAYYKHIKANHYSTATPLAPMTLADVKKVTNFEKTQCGITFAT